MRTDRFQPQGPVRDPGRSRWQTAWQTAREVVPLLLFAGTVVGFVTGWIRTDATDAADSRHDKQRQAQFEIDVDKRLNAHTAQIEAIHADRDERTKAANKRTEEVNTDLRARIDELNKRFAERTEYRTNEMAEVKQRVYGLEIKYCGMAGVRLSGCK